MNCIDCGQPITGQSPRCQPCLRRHRNEYKNAWQKLHPEARWYIRYPERASAAYKRRYNSDPEKHIERAKMWRQANKIRRRAWARLHARRVYHRKHPRPKCETEGCDRQKAKWAKRFCLSCQRFYASNRYRRYEQLAA